MSRYQDFRLNVPYASMRGLTEEEAAAEYLASGNASKHEACEILKRWPGIQARDTAAHEQRRQEYNEYYTQDAPTQQAQQPRHMTDQERAELERNEHWAARAHYRTTQDRLREEEYTRQQEQAAASSTLQARQDGIQHTRNGRPVYAEPQLSEGNSIEIKMPGESVWTRIFTALVGSRK